MNRRQDILDEFSDKKKDQYYHWEMFAKISNLSCSYRLRILHNEKVIGSISMILSSNVNIVNVL